LFNANKREGKFKANNRERERNKYEFISSFAVKIRVIVVVKS
jgi:hypothetical protein